MQSLIVGCRCVCGHNNANTCPPGPHLGEYFDEFRTSKLQTTL